MRFCTCNNVNVIANFNVNVKVNVKVNVNSNSNRAGNTSAKWAFDRGMRLFQYIPALAFP